MFRFSELTDAHLVQSCIRLGAVAIFLVGVLLYFANPAFCLIFYFVSWLPFGMRALAIDQSRRGFSYWVSILLSVVLGLFWILAGIASSNSDTTMLIALGCPIGLAYFFNLLKTISFQEVLRLSYRKTQRYFICFAAGLVSIHLAKLLVLNSFAP